MLNFQFSIRTLLQNVDGYESADEVMRDILFKSCSELQRQIEMEVPIVHDMYRFYTPSVEEKGNDHQLLPSQHLRYIALHGKVIQDAKRFLDSADLTNSLSQNIRDHHHIKFRQKEVLLSFLRDYYFDVHDMSDEYIMSLLDREGGKILWEMIWRDIDVFTILALLQWARIPKQVVKDVLDNVDILFFLIEQAE